MPPSVFRATCFVYFFLGNATSLISYLIGGFPLTEAFHEYIYLLPALALGVIAGHKCICFVPSALLRRLIFAMLYTASTYTIVSILMKSF